VLRWFILVVAVLLDPSSEPKFGSPHRSWAVYGSAILWTER
jgi:hypothetical protein